MSSLVAGESEAACCARVMIPNERQSSEASRMRFMAGPPYVSLQPNAVYCYRRKKMTFALADLSAGGFAGLGVVVTFTVNGRHFGAHAAEIRGKLAAVVNRVMQADHEEQHCGPLEEAAEVNDFC